MNCTINSRNAPYTDTLQLTATNVYVFVLDYVFVCFPTLTSGEQSPQ